MKKLISFILIIITMFSVFAVSVSAENNETIVSQSIEYLDNGCYIVTTITIEDMVSRATSTKTGSKTSTAYNADNEKLVEMKLTGTFSYTGSSSTCTNATATYTVYSDRWKVTSATATKSGNKAIGDFVAKRYTLLIPVETLEKTITITCSNTGVLS